MFPKKTDSHSLLAAGALCASVVFSAPLRGQIFIDPTGGPFLVCAFSGRVQVSDVDDNCEANRENVTSLTFGSGVNNVITFSDAGTATFTNTTVQMSGLQAYSGTSAFNSTVTFTGPSVTFSTGTTFQNAATFNGTSNFTAAMTTTNIANSGGITTSTLNASTSLTASAGANINMGGNQVHGVSAGVANTDAVNVAQLNAAVSGVTTDVTALQTDVTTLQSNVTTLETNIAANSADIGALQSDVATNTADIGALETGLANESAARIAADTVLDNRIDALEVITANLNDRFDRAADRADSGTAAAVALSGAMFLPGKAFNLTGNIGAYRGAVAGALQFGALLSDRVAVNAGASHGFNKRGKTALRAGFTIGF